MSLTLLEEYIETGNIQALADLLLSNPALAVSQTSHGISVLMLSCYYKKPEISALIMKYITQISLFEAAALGKFEEVAHLLYLNPHLINEFSEDGFTPLGLAAYFGHEEVTRYLLLKGADPNIPSKNEYQVYPIHSAAAANFTMVVKMLLEAGSQVNIAQKSGLTPLHSAAHNGNIELLIVLLEAGALVNARMENGKTPAHLAAEKGYLDIARILAE